MNQFRQTTAKSTLDTFNVQIQGSKYTEEEDPEAKTTISNSPCSPVFCKRELMSQIHLEVCLQY